MKSFKIALKLSLVLWITSSFIYPTFLTIVTQFLFPYQANGSLIKVNDEVVGSALIGEEFTQPQYFTSRVKEDAVLNLAPSNDLLYERIETNLNYFLANNPTVTANEIPMDLLNLSASGVDPHISVEAARIQVERVSRETGVSVEQLEQLINEKIEPKQIGILGIDKINVLKLNIALNELLAK